MRKAQTLSGSVIGAYYICRTSQDCIWYTVNNDVLDVFCLLNFLSVSYTTSLHDVSRGYLLNYSDDHCLNKDSDIRFRQDMIMLGNIHSSTKSNWNDFSIGRSRRKLSMLPFSLKDPISFNLIHPPACSRATGNMRQYI